MTTGASAADANSHLNVYRGTTFTGYSALYLQFHTADPGAAGTTAASTAVTARNAVTWNAPAGGSMTLNTLANYSSTGTETLSHWALFTASSGGTFVRSGALTTPIPVINGSVITWSTLTVADSPIAA